MSETRSARPTVMPDLLIDVILVLAFVLIGMRTHDGMIDLAGIWHTSWPFLAGLLLGWLAARAWRRPDRIWPTGVIIWVATVAVGMVLRMLSGQGTDIAFVIVATVTVGAFLVGWRGIGVLIARILRRRAERTQRAEDAVAVDAAAQAEAKAALNTRPRNLRTPGM